MSRPAGIRLGRGLAALLGDEPTPSTAARTIHAVPVDRLDPNPYQPRGTIQPGSLDELAASIRIQGILQPLIVRPSPHVQDRYELVAGERRWRAAELIGLTTVPCLVHHLTDDQSAAAALVENLQRLDLNSIEEAEGYHRLQTVHGLTQEKLSDVVGKSRSHVANTLRLLKLPTLVQDHVRAGVLTAGHARALLGHPDPLAAAQQIISENLSVREAEHLPGKPTERARPRAMPRDSEVGETADLGALERDMSDVLGLPVTIRSEAGRGMITLRFSTLEQLDLLLARLGNVSGPIFRSS